MEEKQNFQTSQDFSISMLKPESEEAISEAIKHCYKKNIPLAINGLGSKKNIGKNFQSQKTLDLSNYSGIIKYEPEELYIKVKSGTSIKEIKEELDKKNQQLAFEPNDFGFLFEGESNEGTIGGVLSSNFAGPRRFKVGSARDHILGFKGINGKGEIIKSGGTVVKNVTGYDLSKIITGSFGTLSVFTEISVKVLPKADLTKTLVIENPHLKKGLEYLNVALGSSTDPSGGVFYPEYFRNQFVFNDLTTEGPITAIRIEGSKLSVDERINKLLKELNVSRKEISILESSQSNIFWENTRCLKVFKNLKDNLLRIIVPASEVFDLINRLKSYNVKYFIDWGGNLVWLQVDEINLNSIKEIRSLVKNLGGYLTIIKVEESLKASIDIFTIDEVKYKISEKIKKSFDPKRILNPGKMYTGI
ncbi:FAD-binding protein [Pelagibacteraceae bacterium]|nr:FAD-binding protein [Pelagibacteraceae bacterium]